ncbi:two-component system, chemotaxis family, response regulator CheB [Fibrella aestuarina BUZ 2]|uniref:protein-glutamate methylesterase n=1 Tax=Fibrella aestuarina BUZ 2 TaxID=1166018 RepID=I0KAQ1_9BACT|nr:chemotaxis protein CheB [Fibrella aestuarina]CCH01204.1 two-component system, chemotaxis family, response regulator CheB [Fibrella aestuarina BUZ 2]
MKKRTIIVIGASTGGLDALKKLIGALPPDLAASVFVVWHIAPSGRGIVPDVLGRVTTIPVTNAYNGQLIQTNHIYIAPPDHHLLLEDGYVRVSRGPKENRFRPAIDPLFRSAAYIYGNQVIGVVLTGALDDGTAGLWTIKQRGGLALVQDPAEAEVPSMPESAIREVAVDYVLPIARLATTLTRLVGEDVPEAAPVSPADDKRTAIEIGIAAEAKALDTPIFEFGQLSPFTCPECHGVLTVLKEGTLSRFRCHTGHAYSADTLLASLTEAVEDRLYDAIRGMAESVMLMNHIGDHYAEANQPRQAAFYFQRAKEAEQRIDLVRRVALSQQTLSQENIDQPEPVADSPPAS